MTYLLEAIKPARIYIKQCPHCNKKYMGKHIGKNIESYKGSGVYWSDHLKYHKVNPIHIWNSDWFYDTSIVEYALNLSEEFNITESDDWFNLKPEDGINGGGCGEDGQIKRKATMADPDWKGSIGKEATSKRLEKMDYSVIAVKISKTKNDPKWKEEVGLNATEQMVKNKDHKLAGINASLTKQSESYKNTIGFKQKTNRLNTVQSQEWKDANYKTCEHCGKGPMDPSNFARYHGPKCKTFVTI